VCLAHGPLRIDIDAVMRTHATPMQPAGS
jgi:hypothetical protein